MHRLGPDLMSQPRLSDLETASWDRESARATASRARCEARLAPWD